MKNILLFFSLFFAAFIISSCDSRRDDNGDLLFGLNPIDNGGNNPSTPNKLLIKTTSTDDEGEVVIYNYSYDDKRRLTGITSNDNSKTVAVLYTTEGKLSKVTITDNFNGTISTEVLVPTYTNNQISSLENTTSENGQSIKRVSTYAYSSNGWPSIVKENIIDPDDNTTVVATIVSNISYSGSNISKWNMKQTIKIGLPVPVFDFLQNIELTVELSNFDNKINPYNLFPKDYLIATIHTESDASSILGYSKNNTKTVKMLFSFDGSEPIEGTDTATYTYDNDGYPLSSSTSSGGTIVFEYK